MRSFARSLQGLGMSFKSTAWIALDDVVEEIIDRRGVTPLKLGGDFVTEGHRVISAKLLKERTVQLDADEARYVSSEIYKKWMKLPLRAGDVIMTSEAPLGELAYLHEDKDWVLGQRLFAIRPRKELMNGRFLYYVLQTNAVRSDIQGRATGTTVQGIRQAELRLVKVPVPSLAEQNEAASFLGAIDDRITLLRETNKTLEAIAQAIFKSWFIDFDPVRAKMEGRAPAGMDEETAALFPDELVESELGLVPKGWSATSIEEICSTITNGGTPSRSHSEFWQSGSIPWYKTGDFSDGFLLEPSEKITDVALSNSSVKLLPENAVLMAIYAAPTVGRLGVLTRPSTFNQACTGMVAKNNVGTWFLYWTLYFGRDWFNSRANGAAQQNISKAIVASYRLVKPMEQLLSVFDELTDPLHKKIRRNVEQVETLSALRDTLLPRLISGKLRLADAVAHVD
jgi:type I restriction enzyme S subunit